jgi:hypothetical protein
MPQILYLETRYALRRMSRKHRIVRDGLSTIRVLLDMTAGSGLLAADGVRIAATWIRSLVEPATRRVYKGSIHYALSAECG